MTKICAFVWAFAALLTPALASPFSDGDVEAVARAHRDLRLGFTVSGRVAEVLVEPGDRVAAGEPLVRLADPEGEAQVRLLRLRAESELEADAAKAEWDLAVVQSKLVREAQARGAASPFEVQRSDLEAERSRLAYELFVQRQEEARMQLEQATRRHEQFTLRAPIDGVVDEVGIDLGETIEALDPAVRLVSTSTLRVDAPVPTGRTLGMSAGDRAWVVVDLGGETTTVEGTVVQLAAVADAASDTRRVRVEVPNEAGLPAGIRVRVRFTAPVADAGGAD